MKKILIADDEEGIIALVSATLGLDGEYRVLEAKNGEEALRIAKEERPDLVIVDILMPRIDGFDVCRMLKSDPETKPLKVILLTALAQDFDRKKGIEVGADDYFVKPFNPTSLLERVEEMLVSEPSTT